MKPLATLIALLFLPLPWKNILSRINLIKASVEVDSQLGRRGTTLIVSMPWGRQEDEAKKKE